MDDALDPALTAAQNAERRTLWTRQQVIGMLRLQRRDDAALVRERIRGFELDDHWAVLYRSSDVETLPDLLYSTERIEP